MAIKYKAEMKVHVLTNKAEILNEKLNDKVVIVLDILFATTSIVSAFANGCNQVVPMPDSRSALEISKLSKFKDYLLSGELNADTLEGFSHPTPMAIIASGINDRGLIYCTTNGTVALHNAKEANFVYAGCLLNGQALVRHILDKHPTSTVLIVCSGSSDQFNLEDFYGAGQLVDLFMRENHDSQLNFSDASLAASYLYKSDSATSVLNISRVGQMMLRRNLESEVKYAAQENITDVIPILHSDGYLRVY